MKYEIETKNEWVEIKMFENTVLVAEVRCGRRSKILNTLSLLLGVVEPLEE